jgi:imidazoleglycerol phosphate synthase glutamine amidotransferase subunit HisH
MILLINICKYKLHLEEFVAPVGNILIKNNIKGFIRHYTCLTKNDLEKASKIIICGTSLKDNEFLDNLEKFNWIKTYKKPILGICGGMHILGLIYDGKKQKNKQIGLIDNEYHLHNYIVKSPEFKYNKTKMKHHSLPYEGILTHPEVRNKEVILKFAQS